MRSLLALLFLLTQVLASASHFFPHGLDPSTPIYIGEVFWPPSMTFLVWLPSSNPTWCYTATEVSLESLFALEGIDSLQIHGYFHEHAYLTREGGRFAECFITPESTRIGTCEEAKDKDCDKGHKFYGPGTRKWTCWINAHEGSNERDGRKVGRGIEGVDARLTGDMKPTTVAVGAAAASSEILGLLHRV